MKEIDICEYMERRKEGDLLLDVRDKIYFNHGTIEGAINVPVEHIKELYALPKNKDIYVFCQTGDYSGEVVELLTDAGYNAYNLTGGYIKYLRQIFADNKE